MHSNTTEQSLFNRIVTRKGVPFWGRRVFWGYVMILPFIVHLVLFTGGPLIASLLLSFTRWNFGRPPKWIGLDNYVKAFGDDKFLDSFANTTYFVAVGLPVTLVISLFVAVALNTRIRGIVLFRTFYFLPVVTSQVAIGLVFFLLYQNSGLLNSILGIVGIGKVFWLGSKMAMNSLIVIYVWTTLGTMIVYWLAGLQSVPRELHEAAEIDGAGWWARLRFVTIPLLTPVAFFLVVIGIIGSYQVFTTAYVLTDGWGGPGNATLVLALYIYQLAFRSDQAGYASMVAYAMFAVLFAVTIVQWRLQGRWVHYGG